MSEQIPTSEGELDGRAIRFYALRSLGDLAEQANNSLRAFRVSQDDQEAHGELITLQRELERVVHFCEMWQLHGWRPSYDFDDAEKVAEVPDNITIYLRGTLTDVVLTIQNRGSRTSVDRSAFQSLTGDAPSLVENLRTNYAKMLSDLASLIASNSSAGFSGSNVELLENERRKLRFQEVQDSAEEARDKAVEAARASTEAAGISATSSLAVDFGNRARDEAVSATRFRVSTIAVLVLILAFGGWWLIYTASDPPSWQVALLKLAVVVPAGILAAYLARQASFHRSRAESASYVEIRLKTLEAYISPLAEEEKSRVRMSFAGVIFSSSSVKSDEDFDLDVTRLGELVKGLTDLTSRISSSIRPGSR